MEIENQEVMERTCLSCGETFTITESEVRFYESKELALPKRCAACRKARKAAAQAQEQSAPREEKKPKSLDDLLRGAGII